MKIIYSVILFIVISTIFGCAAMSRIKNEKQLKQLLEKEITRTVPIQYLLYLPDDYEKLKMEWPLILFLHGASERGDSLQKIKAHGPPKLIDKGKKFQFIIISPQCPENQWWSTGSLDTLLKEVTKNYRVDKNRIYITG